MNFSPALRISYFILDFFYAFVIHVFYRAWFGKFRKLSMLFMIYGVFIAADCLIYFTQESAVIFSVSAYFLFLMCTLIYSRLNSRSFIGAGILLILSISGEMLSIAFRTVISDNAFSTIIMYILSRILLYFFVVLTIRIFRNRSIYNSMPHYSAGIILTPIISTWLIVYISYLLGYSMNYDNNYADILLLITYFLILALNIISFYMFDRQSNKYLLEQKNVSLQNVLETQHNEQLMNSEHEQNVRRIRHDLINYIIGVKSMMENGCYDKAIASLDSKIEDLCITKYHAHTGCAPLDSIINYKAAKAEKQNIRIITNLIVRAVPPIKAEDISIIVGNGMDNAIEYLTCHPKVQQVIQIDLDYGPAGFILGIQNYVEKPVKLLESGYVPSTKSGPNHGFGIESADIIAHRYDGEIIISCKKNIFVYGAVLHPGPWVPAG